VSSSNVDPDIQAAFAGTTPSASSHANVDPDIAAAFKESPVISGPYDPNRHAFGDEFVNQLGAAASGAYHTMVGGFKGIGTLAVTRDVSKATQAIEDEEAKAYQAPQIPSKLKPSDQAAMTMQPPTGLGDFAAAHGASPGLSTALAIAPTALASFIAPRGMGPEAPPVSAQSVADAAAARQSGGAAAASPDVMEASPTLQGEIARGNPATLNQTALQNHLEADRFGIQLSKGQATRDPGQFSREQNTTSEPVVQLLNKQNGQMVDAIDNIRREASPTTVGNDYIENGRAAVDALKAYDEPIQADIRTKYKALTDANGGSVPIDPGQFLSNVDGALKKGFLTKTAAASPEVSEVLDSVRSGEPMDFESFENARTRLASAQRAGGSAGEAARIVRGQLEQIPLSAEAAPLKGLADTARSAAKTRFDALEADPAYQAAVDDVSAGNKRGSPTPLADTFLDKYALSKSAPQSQVDLMMQKIKATDPDAAGAVASHTLNAIRKGAVNANGNVLPNGYNSALQKYGPKLDSLVEPGTRDDLESLGRVITNARVAPPGNYVNYSKSGVITNAAQGIGEGLVNAKTFGMGVPVIKGMIQSGFAKDAVKPGAGINP